MSKYDKFREHTPGPWRVIVDDEDAPRILAGLDGEEKLIGEFPSNGHDPDPALMPDVRLMAAAPELLELLSNARVMLGLLVGAQDEGSRRYVEPMAVDLVEQIEAATKQATKGET